MLNAVNRFKIGWWSNVATTRAKQEEFGQMKKKQWNIIEADFMF